MEKRIVNRNLVKRELTWKEEITDILHSKEEDNLFLNWGDRRPCKEQAIISQIFIEQRLYDNYMNLYIKCGLCSKKKNVTWAFEYLVRFNFSLSGNLYFFILI